MIYLLEESVLGTQEIQLFTPSFHFFCPGCGTIWARIITAQPNHRVLDTIYCQSCARTNEHGLWDGVMDVHFFPEYKNLAPKPVLIHNFMQLYDNRLRLEQSGIPINSAIRLLD